MTLRRPPPSRWKPWEGFHTFPRLGSAGQSPASPSRLGVAALTACLVCGLVAACGTDIPAAPTGERVSGTVSYAGSAQASMLRPAARILLFLDFPPSGSPFAMLNIERPDFSKPLPYELAWVAPNRYKVVGQLFDLGAPDSDPTTLPAAGYPSMCALSRPDDGFVTVTDSISAQGIDLHLYDLGGQTDPCFVPAAACPLPGRATMSLVVRSSRVPSSADSLVVALFSEFPSTSPASARKVAGQDLRFPETIVDNDLAPRSYPVLYVCLDVGSNSGMGLCTAEDAFVLDSTPIDLAADTITNLIVDLDTGTVSVAGVDAPGEHGCN
jgi:hypothetical protein